MKIRSVIALAAALFLLSCSGDRDKVPAYKPTAGAELAPVKLPPIKERVLENGLKLIAIEHNELPVVAFSLMVKTGAANEPMGLAGLASFTADLLTKGTKSRSATDIASEIDFIGGSLDASAEWDRSNISCQVLKHHFDTGLDLFADVALSPVFQKEEIERLRKRKISSYISGKDDPSNLANEAFADFLFGKHPFGYPDDGSEETLKKISRKDILAFYSAYYAPNNSVIIVSGNINPEEVFDALKEEFGGWVKSELREVTMPEIAPPAGHKIRLVDKPDASQSQIRMGHFGLARSHPDFFPIIMMNYILGEGGFSSRLMKTVRSEMGLTYSIRSSFGFRKAPGPFTISTFTKNESVGEAIAEIIRQMKQFQTEGASKEELSDAKSYRTGSYPLRFETPSQIAGQLMNVELYGLGDDYIELYRDRIQAVTPEQVLQAAVKFIDPENMAIVVVGKKEEVLDQLMEFGEVEVVGIE